MTEEVITSEHILEDIHIRLIDSREFNEWPAGRKEYAYA